jgi:outer membrane biosynthesis protein TonB
MPHSRRPTPALLVLCLALALGAGGAHAAEPPVAAPAADAEASPDAPVVATEASTADPAAEPTGCIAPVRLSGGIPRYPVDAVRNRVQGAVRVHAEISAEGVVTLAEAIEGPRLLRTASADFIRASTYSPKTCGGVPVATTIESLVEFNLSWMRR